MDKYYFDSEIARLINPPPASKYCQKQKESLEDVYLSQKNTPLGQAPVSSVSSKIKQKGFGVSTIKDLSAADLIFPSKSRLPQTAYSENFTYKRPDDSLNSAGVKSEVIDNSGEQIKDVFNQNINKNFTIIQPKYAKKNLDPRSSRMIPENGNLIRNMNECENKVEKRQRAMKDRHLVEVLWNILKVKNHENFPDLISSFKSYRNGDDKITLCCLQKMCQNFGISAPLYILEKLLDECDIIDKDGVLNYEEFIHCLHWKDLLLENENFTISKYANDWKEGMTYSSKAKETLDRFKTSASFIGDHKYSVCSRVAGLSSLSRDNRTKARGVAEFNERGDAPSMIQPSIFAKYGVFEEDLNELLTKNKIISIFNGSGMKISNLAFETAWQKVSVNGKASIGKMWNAIKKICLSYY